MLAIIETYAPTAALLTPLLALATMNILLFLSGERGTLLLPTLGLYSIQSRQQPVNTLPANRPPKPPQSPANDPVFRHVA